MSSTNRHLIALLFAGLLIFPCLSALAGDALPAEVKSAYTDFPNWTIVDYAILNDDACAVLCKNGARRLVNVHERVESSWQLVASNHHAAPSNANTIFQSMGSAESAAAFTVAYIGNSSVIRSATYEKHGGEYFLMEYQLTYDQFVRFGDESIIFHSPYTEDYVVAMAVPRLLEFVDLRDLPRTYADTLMLNEAQYQPIGVYAPKQVHFAQDKRFWVYSAPNENSVRANNGKAAVSTNGVVMVYGYDGEQKNWLLVGYEASGGAWRVGYICTSQPNDVMLPQLQWNHKVKNVKSDVSLTDNPLNHSPYCLATLPKGTQVQVLAEMKELAYVEGMVNGKLVREFLEMKVLE